MHVTHGEKYCSVLKQAVLSHLTVLFTISKRELVEALFVSLHHILCEKVIMLQGIIELSYPK